MTTETVIVRELSSNQMDQRAVLSVVAARRGKVLTGCLIAAGIVLAILVGLGVWAAMSWRGWVSGGITSVTSEMLKESELPQEQKDRVLARVDGVAKDFKDAKITMAQLGQIMGKISEGPLLPLGIVWAVESQHVTNSALTADEKAEGKLNLQRLARGVFEKKIPKNNLQTVIAPISTPGPNGQPQMKQKVTIEELRAFLANAKAEADKAEIPNEPYTVDVATEVDNAVNEVLGTTAPAGGGG